MQAGVRIAVCALGCFVCAATAAAESWSIVEGRIRLDGRKRPLAGTFEASLEPGDAGAPAILNLDDFAFTLGRRELLPRIPVEYEGLVPIAWQELGDAIVLEGEQVESVHVRSGGKLVDESADEMTFRFLELRADASHGGYATGHLGDTDLPRRLVLKGDVYEVRQSFGLPDASCGAPPPGSGGSTGGGAVITYGRFDVNASGTETVTQRVAARFGRRTFVWQPAEGGSVVLTGRSTGDASSIEGPLSTGGHAVLSPAGVQYGTAGSHPVAQAAPPTLEALGIVAPAGAEISLDASGALRIASPGDLLVEHGLLPIEISGLTSVTLSTPGNIVVTGGIHLPEGVSLRIEAGGEVHIDGPVPLPGDDVEVGAPGSGGLPDFCDGLAPILPADERRVGSFSLVASAARQVKVDVRLDAKERRIVPGSDQRLRAVISGSRSLDVRDLDLDSLRLGRGEAEPIRSGVRLVGSPEGGRQRAIATHFSVRDAGIAYGDREVCLTARTRDGELLEGCDEIRVESPEPQAR